jgi:hypothetical protein
MTRYQILIPDTLLDKGLQWPPGASLVEQLECGTAGTHWHLFEDPDAPEELEGKDVEITLRRGRVSEDAPETSEPVIASRRAIVTHLVPQDDSGLMACCGVPAWEVSRSDRITADKELVTCGGAP